MRRSLALLVFFLGVVAFTFVSTFVHEMGHAMAWDATERPDVIVASDRHEARERISSEQTMFIDGRPYRVMQVERTTIALYPMTILATGATLGLAPAEMLPDPVLASTFYSLDEEHFASLAAGKDPAGWQEAATPMIVNGLLALPVWAWLLWRPGPVSMAAAWANAAEWRYNVHHAEEVGIPPILYMAGSLLVMAVTAGAITFLATSGRGGRGVPTPSRWRRSPVDAWPRTSEQVLPGITGAHPAAAAGGPAPTERGGVPPAHGRPAGGPTPPPAGDLASPAPLAPPMRSRPSPTAAPRDADLPAPPLLAVAPRTAPPPAVGKVAAKGSVSTQAVATMGTGRRGQSVPGPTGTSPARKGPGRPGLPRQAGPPTPAEGPPRHPAGTARHPHPAGTARHRHPAGTARHGHPAGTARHRHPAAMVAAPHAAVVVRGRRRPKTDAPSRTDR